MSTPILNDSGGEFRAEVVRALSRRLDAGRRRIRPGHAWTNRRIKRVLGTYVKPSGVHSSNLTIVLRLYG